MPLRRAWSRGCHRLYLIWCAPLTAHTEQDRNPAELRRAMNRELWTDERGGQVVEWIVVTLIMIVATFAILQAVGGEISAWVTGAIAWVRNLLGI